MNAWNTHPGITYIKYTYHTNHIIIAFLLQKLIKKIVNIYLNNFNKKTLRNENFICNSSSTKKHKTRRSYRLSFSTDSTKETTNTIYVLNLNYNYSCLISVLNKHIKWKKLFVLHCSKKTKSKPQKKGGYSSSDSHSERDWMNWILLSISAICCSVNWCVPLKRFLRKFKPWIYWRLRRLKSRSSSHIVFSRLANKFKSSSPVSLHGS